MRTPRLAAAAALCLCVAAAVGGCGGHSRRERARTGTLSIYTSLPFDGPYAADARSIYDAEQLALTQAGGVVDGFKVVLRRRDDASSATGQPDPALVAENARIAAADPSTIAYIGELAPGSSRASSPILSAAGILQVSPGDTATNVTGATFARVVPTAAEEAVAELVAMQKLGVKRLYLLKDRSTYGTDIATAALSNAASYGIVVVNLRRRYLGPDTRPLLRAIKRLKAGGLLYAGEPGDGVAAFWNALSATDARIKKFASAALTDAASWDLTTPAARYNTFLSAPGLPSRALPRAGSQFVADFMARYGSQWERGIFGYVAMSGVLDALYGLGPRAKDRREKLVTAFLTTKSLPSVLGPYSIVDGQTTFQSYFFIRYPRSGPPVPYIP